MKEMTNNMSDLTRNEKLDIINHIREFKEAYFYYRSNKERYKTNEFYLTADGLTIEIICKDYFMVLGVTTHSSIESQLGTIELFLWDELTQISNLPTSDKSAI